MTHKQTNYSYATSLPTYLDNKEGKAKQRNRIMRLIKRGFNNLKKISKYSGIESSTVAARVNELIKYSQVKYDGNVIYKGRLRKKIIAL